MVVRPENSQAVSGNKGRHEERQPLNMIPMRVGNEQGNILVSTPFSHNVFTGLSNSGARIDEDIVVTVSDFYTGRIAAIAHGLLAGASNGSAISPKIDFHLNAFDKVFGFCKFLFQNFVDQDLNTFACEPKALINFV
jgi:hypothetical protein